MNNIPTESHSDARQSKTSGWLFWSALLIIWSLDLLRQSLTLLQGPVTLELDAFEYWTMGKLARDGDIWLFGSPIAYRTPAYAWFIGWMQYFFGSYALFGVVLVQHLCLHLTSLATGRMASILTGSRLAFLTAYGLSIPCVTRCWYANTVLSETLFAFLFLIFLWILLLYGLRPTLGRLVGLSTFLSLSILVRPVPQLLILPLALGLMLLSFTKIEGASVRQGFKHALFFLLIQIVLLGPWYLRNHQLFGETFLTRLPSVNKWEVCFQDGSCANLPFPKHAATERLFNAWERAGHDPKNRYCYDVTASLERAGLSKEEVDRLVDEVCIEAVAQNPGIFLVAALRRAANFWRCVPNAYPAFGGPSPYYDEQFTWGSSKAKRLYEPILCNTLSRHVLWNEITTFMIGMGLIWMVASKKTRIFAVCLITIFTYFTAVTAAVEVENYRYRMVLEPAFILCFVVGLHGAISKWTQYARGSV